MDEAWELSREIPWKFADARDRLDEILDLAARQKPQRIRRGERDVVVLDADAYFALTDAADQALPLPPVQQGVCTCSGRTFLNALRDSPWRDALEGGDWPWAWNWLTREWSHLGPLPRAASAAAARDGEGIPARALPRRPKGPGENGCAPSGNVSHPPDRKWVWEWDEESQCYALPWAKDLDPAAYPGLPFLNAMQNSPLAEALRTGEILEEEWRALFNRGGG